MKGLLIKDLRLMKVQKNFFIIFIVIAVGMAAFSYDISFMLGFLSFVLSLFTLSTISYDEFDNGNAFLFTLPISRTSYTAEKYCLALLFGGGSCIFASILAVIFGIFNKTADFSEIAMTALAILPVLIVIQSVMIPFQLKFGGEKGRIALIGALGLLFIVGIAFVKIAEMLGIDIIKVIDNLPTVSMGVMAAIIFFAVVIILFISVKISISIMKGKEF